jgi:hypothetical protein
MHTHTYLYLCEKQTVGYLRKVLQFSGDWYVISEVVRPFKLPGKVTCDKLHYSAEEVGNVTRTHIEMRLKLDDGSEKIWEGKGQAVMPGYASTTVMAWKPSDHNKWFGKHTYQKNKGLLHAALVPILLHIQICCPYLDLGTDLSLSLFSSVSPSMFWHNS